MHLLVLDPAQTHNCRGRFSIHGFYYKPLKFKWIKISCSGVEGCSDIQQIVQQQNFNHVQGGKLLSEITLNFSVRKTLSRGIYIQAKYQEPWNSSSVSSNILLSIFVLNLSFPVCKMVMIKHNVDKANPMCFCRSICRNKCRHQHLIYKTVEQKVYAFCGYQKLPMPGIFPWKRSQDKKQCQQKILSIISLFLSEDQQNCFALLREGARSSVCAFLHLQGLKI